MWALRIGLSFLLIILMGRQIPQIVHNLTPFEAKPVAIKNVEATFARSRMINFFEYRITYDFKVFVENARRHELFGFADLVNYKLQFPLETERKMHPHSFFSQYLNTTITSVSVAPLNVSGVFLVEISFNNFAFGNSSFQLTIPGAEPLFNPLLAAVVVIFLLTMVCGFAVEILSQNQRYSAYTRMVEEGDEELNSNRANRRETTCLKLVHWMIVVAVVEGVVIGVAMITGVVPYPFQ